MNMIKDNEGEDIQISRFYHYAIVQIPCRVYMTQTIQYH